MKWLWVVFAAAWAVPLWVDSRKGRRNFPPPLRAADDTPAPLRESA